MPYEYADLPASPYAGDWSLGAVFGASGVIWVGEIPLPRARELVGEGWQVVGEALPEPAPAPAPPPLTPQPGPPPGPLPEPINDPVIEPRTPVTPQPLPPAGEPTIPPEPQLPPAEPIRPGLPDDIPRLPPIIGGSLGPVLVGIGGLLYPSPIQPDPEMPGHVPMPDIPAPNVQFPEPDFPLPEPYSPPFDYPQAPDVIVVSAPSPSPSQRSNPWPVNLPIPQTIGIFPYPFVNSRRSSPPLTQQLPAPTPRTPPVPMPTAPPLPLPGTPPLPTPPSAPPRSSPPLTQAQTPEIQSPPQGETCETPSQTKERREKKREDCRKLVRIKVKAHYRKVCLSEAIEHEAKRYRKKIVRKYITKPAGKLGRDAADWALEHLGLTPYAQQAKDVKKRVSDLTKRQKRYRVEIPGTHIDFDPVDFIPKTKP